MFIPPPTPRPPPRLSSNDVGLSTTDAAKEFYSFMGVVVSSMRREQRNVELWFNYWNKNTTDNMSDTYIAYALGRLQSSAEMVLDIPGTVLKPDVVIATEELIVLTCARLNQVLSGQKTPPEVVPVESPQDPVDGDDTGEGNLPPVVPTEDETPSV